MINSAEIFKIFQDCMFKKEEMLMGPPAEDKFTPGLGIIQNFGFHPERVASYKPVLAEMIQDLHPNFLEDQGGGWTFLNLPFDKNERQWGEQPNAEQFFALCNANGMADFQMPREFWSVLPGGVPYVVFNPTGIIGAKKKELMDTLESKLNQQTGEVKNDEIGTSCKKDGQ